MEYEFSANGTIFGRYQGATLTEAREAFAQDAGYTSWGAMVEQAEESGGNAVEAREVIESGEVFGRMATMASEQVYYFMGRVGCERLRAAWREDHSAFQRVCPRLPARMQSDCKRRLIAEARAVEALARFEATEADVRALVGLAGRAGVDLPPIEREDTASPERAAGA
jgi:hypothetical protein